MAKKKESSNGVKRLNQVTSTSKVLAAVLFIILPFVGFYLGMEYQKSLNEPLMMTVPENSAPVTACTMDVKVCPDGTSVGRSGPNCEFEACPGE